MSPLDWVKWARSMEVTPTGAKCVLLVLATYADESGRCYPGQQRLATESGQSTASVKRHLAGLEKAKLVTRTHRQGKGGHRTSDEYQLIPRAHGELMDESKGSLCTGQGLTLYGSKGSNRATKRPGEVTSGEQPEVTTVTTASGGGCYPSHDDQAVAYVVQALATSVSGLEGLDANGVHTWLDDNAVRSPKAYVEHLLDEVPDAQLCSWLDPYLPAEEEAL